MSRKDQVVELDLEILSETDKALRVSDGDEFCWVAKSLIKNYEEVWEVGNTLEMQIPEWLAEQLNLI
jgi:hypothetical protein